LARRALDGDGPVEGFDDPFRDGEAKARTAMLAIPSRIHPIEAIEEMGQVIGSNADAGIMDSGNGLLPFHPAP